MMTLPRISVERIKIAVAALSFALFAQTAIWLVYDVIDRGFSDAWSVWTTGTGDGLPATASFDLGLAALQLAAGYAILRGSRGAGGLLVTASMVTIAFRLPVVWYVLSGSSSAPWVGVRTGPPHWVIGASAIINLLMAAALGALLLRVRHLENEEAAALDELSGGGIRPIKVTATTSGFLLAVLNIFYIGRNTRTAIDTNSDVWLDLLIGRGSVQTAFGVSQPWRWGSLTLLCGIGLLLAWRRRPIAPGFSLGLSYFMVPTAFTSLWASFAAGTFTDTAIDSVQSVLELVGSLAVVGLVYRETQSIRRSAGSRLRLPEPPAPAGAPVGAGASSGEG